MRIAKRRFAISDPAIIERRPQAEEEENNVENDADDEEEHVTFGVGTFVLAKGNSTARGKAAAVSRKRRNEEAEWQNNKGEKSLEAVNSVSLTSYV